jgi:1-acyl-sn-glycerol-3-phosphate acyltransferase
MLSEILYKVSRIVIQGYAKLMLKMDVRWRSSLPAGPVLFAANHPSTTDPVFLHLIIKNPMSIMITSKVFSIPFLGSYMRGDEAYLGHPRSRRACAGEGPQDP